MRTILRAGLMIFAFTLAVSPAFADSYSDTIALFRNAGQSGVSEDLLRLCGLPDSR
jgi:hypothetical protein